MWPSNAKKVHRPCAGCLKFMQPGPLASDAASLICSRVSVPANIPRTAEKRREICRSVLLHLCAPGPRDRARRGVADDKSTYTIPLADPERVQCRGTPVARSLWRARGRFLGRWILDWHEHELGTGFRPDGSLALSFFGRRLSSSRNVPVGLFSSFFDCVLLKGKFVY